MGHVTRQSKSLNFILLEEELHTMCGVPIQQHSCPLKDEQYL